MYSYFIVLEVSIVLTNKQEYRKALGAQQMAPSHTDKAEMSILQNQLFLLVQGDLNSLAFSFWKET